MNNLMFLSGFFSLLQIIIFPGAILIKFLKIKTLGSIQFFLYSFGLSLFSNYLIVCLLTSLKIYLASIIYLIFIIEAVCLAILFLGNKNNKRSGKTIKDYYLSYNNYLSSLSVSLKIFVLISSILILFFISLVPINAGTSYYFIDALNHWTRWPVQWAANRFPIRTGHYPQLFPANLSLIYVFTGEPSYQFFPKIFMPLFFISILLIFFDFAISRKSRACHAGLIIYGMILLVFYSVLFILEVNADIPVSFFSFLTYYTIIRNDREAFNIRTIFLVAIFAVSAALTKLAGLYVLSLTGIWIILTLYKYRTIISLPLLIKSSTYLILILICSIFWYLVRPADMVKGLDQSQYLIQGYYIRFVTAAKMLYYTLGSPFLIFLCITITAALSAKETKYIVMLVIIPSLILWAFFFSADFRNLSFAIPFIAYASGYGLREVYKIIVTVKKQYIFTLPKISFKLSNFSRSVFAVIFLIFAFSITGTNSFFNLGVRSAYYFHSIFSGNYGLIYLTEIGYYRYVEYIIGAFRVLCIILFILFAIKNLKIKISHFIYLLISISIISGFKFLTKDNLWEMQVHDKEMVKIHNLYFKVYSFLNIPGKKSFVTVNDFLFSQLIPPSKVHFQYSKDIYGQTQNYCNSFLLLRKNKMSAETLNYITVKLTKGNLVVCFEDEEFIFLRINDKSEEINN